MNIYDIAQKAGVSISTVSRVLNSPTRVSKKTLAKVQNVIQQCNYTPNAMARGLVSSSMKTIGILTSDIRNYQFSQTACTLESVFFDFGYSSILCNTGNKLDKKKDYIHILAEKKVDGVVFIGSVFTDIDIEDSITSYMPDTPIVVANSSLALSNVHYVLIDQNYGLNLAVRHLFEKGHRRIAFIATSDTYNSKRKVKGFLNGLRRHGLPRDDNSVIAVSFGLEGAEKAVGRVLGFDRKSKPTALIFADDVTAFCGVRSLRKRGLVVPRDMAVIGFTNSEYSLYADPPMTSIDIKNETFSFLVANMLHDILRNVEVKPSISMKPDLVVREST